MVPDSLFTQKHAVIEVMRWLLVSERKVSRCAIILLVCIMRRGRRGTKDGGELVGRGGEGVEGTDVSTFARTRQLKRR